MPILGRNSLLLAFTCTALACLAPACGGDDGDSDPNLRPSVDSDARVDSLSDGDWNALCSDVRDYFESAAVERSFTRSTCRMTVPLALAFLGATDNASLRSSCREMYDACASQEWEDDGSVAECTRPAGECSATVAEMVACIESVPAQLEALAATMPSCDDITLEDLSFTPSTPAPAQNDPCAVVEAKCPDFEAPDPGATISEE